MQNLINEYLKIRLPKGGGFNAEQILINAQKTQNPLFSPIKLLSFLVKIIIKPLNHLEQAP